MIDVVVIAPVRAYRDAVASAIASEPELRIVGEAGTGSEALACMAPPIPTVALLDFGIDNVIAVLVKAGIGGLAANFLLYVTANRRLFSVGDMIRDFRKLVAKWKGEVTAEVTAAEKLSDAHLQALKSALMSITGEKSVDLNVKIDPAIIGGLTVKLGSRMVDSSLRTKLNAIKHAMKEAG